MIQKKLLDIQKLRLSVTKNKVNPHFKNGYPDLNEVLDVAVPVLTERKLSLLQTPVLEGLKTTITDTEDDTFVESIIPWSNTTDPQKLGGQITYYRRYSIITMLNLEAEDDDGTIASAPVVTPTARR